ncbi:Autophagy-related protein 6 [Spathaspora sp. JA1]|nr:Autophagy-related protein 6 [Spathaspora sp. JA1]
MSQEGDLTCKKCDTPLILDDSLKKVNLTQLSRLVNKRQPRQEEPNILNPQDYIPQDRLNLYEYVSSKKHNIEPIQYRNYLESEDEEEEEGEPEGEDERSGEASGMDSSSTDNSYLLVLEESEEEFDYANKQSETEDREIRISNRIKTLNKVFEILSNNQDIDHPLSEDCANLLIENYKLKFDQNQREKDSYLSFLRKLKDKDNQLKIYEEEGDTVKFNPELFKKDLDKKLKDSIEEFERLTILEQQSLEELKQLEATKSELEVDLKQYKQELQEIESVKLTEILQQKNKLQLELQDKENKLEQSKAAYHVHLDHIDKLRNLNIYTKIFNITSDKNNKYGMINGFRIGYKVIRSEINAALGQIVLLLIFMIKRLNLKLVNYKLVPMGSQSQIVKFTEEEQGEETTTKSKTVLNLYSTDEFSLGKLFNFNKLDVAMISLLDVVSQIDARLISLDSEIELPYKISPRKDSIGVKRSDIVIVNEDSVPKSNQRIIPIKSEPEEIATNWIKLNHTNSNGNRSSPNDRLVLNFPNRFVEGSVNYGLPSNVNTSKSPSQIHLIQSSPMLNKGNSTELEVDTGFLSGEYSVNQDELLQAQNVYRNLFGESPSVSNNSSSINLKDNKLDSSIIKKEEDQYPSINAKDNKLDSSVIKKEEDQYPDMISLSQSKENSFIQPTPVVETIPKKKTRRKRRRNYRLQINKKVRKPPTMFVVLKVTNKVKFLRAINHRSFSGPRKQSESLGSILFGDRIFNSPFDIKMLQEKSCEKLCTSKYSKSDSVFVNRNIRASYNHNWIIDGLPVASVIKDARTDTTFYGPGFHIGEVDNKNNAHLANHFVIIIDYHKRGDNKFRVVGATAERYSLDRTGVPADAGADQICSLDLPQVLLSKEKESDVLFTYAVQFRESDVAWATRWDKYLHVYDPKIQWFSLINFSLIVSILGIIIGHIIVRTLKNDIVKYNEVNLDDDISDESGWKLVHGDVFRPPKQRLLLVLLILLPVLPPFTGIETELELLLEDVEFGIS